jgi:hypothetical protein
MPVYQSKTAKRRETPPTPYQHGMAATAIFKHTLTAAFVTATDVIEIGTLPAGAQIIAADLVGAGFTAGTTARVALMTGGAGDRDDARVLTGTDLFTGQTVVNAEGKATVAKCLSFVPAADHRGIGVKLSANEAAAPGKKLTLMLSYTL